MSATPATPAAPLPTPDYHLDVTGESCPYPAMHALEALAQLRRGEVLEVVGDCPQSIHNIPLDARNHGHEVLDVRQDGPMLRFLLRAGSAAGVAGVAGVPGAMV